MKKKIAYGVTGLILGCIFLFPIYILIMNSFKTTKGIFTDVLGFPAKGTFTLENYKNAFQELDYIRSFMNSLLITVVTAVLVLLISAMAAWVLVRYKTKASKIIFLIFAGSMLIPFQCVMLPLVGFASKIGLLSLDLYVYGLSNKYGNHNVSWVHKKYSGGIGGSRYN
jgi:raffinose/stachyose/melibiose transport system permease protein